MPKRKYDKNMPSFDQLMKPTIQALITLGGSGTIEEINSKVYEITKLSDDILRIQHADNEARTEVDYRLAWSRTYLKKVGLLINSERGVWALTNANIRLEDVNPDKIVASYKATKIKSDDVSHFDTDSINWEGSWKYPLLSKLLEITPDAFERLAQRILRENGFIKVDVTGKTGDGGIDGKGIMRIHGLVSFHVIFQCKRFKGSVSAGQIRDFRGAMQGRADKGLFITTGTFTSDAKKEATRDGAPPIDLIDGELLCDILKEARLGVKVEQIEDVEIDEDWFKNL